MRFRILWAALPLLIAGVSGCKGDDYDVTSSDWIDAVTENAPIRKLQRELADSPEQKTATAGELVEFSDGSTLWFKALKDSASGADVSGEVVVSFLHLNGTDDFLRVGYPTQTVSTALLSRGSFYYRITHNGAACTVDELWASLPPIPDRIPANKPGLYNGVTLSTGDKVWGAIIPGDASPRVFKGAMRVQDGATVVEDSADGRYITGKLYNHKYRWVSFSYPRSYRQEVAADVTLPGKFTPQNTAVYISQPDSLYLTALVPDFGTATFVTPYKLPLGFPCQAVSISYLDGKYYWGSTTQALPTNGALSVTPQEVSKADLLAKLARL